MYIIDTYEKMNNILNGDAAELVMVAKALNENDNTINLLSEVFHGKYKYYADLLGMLDNIRDYCGSDCFKIKAMNSLTSEKPHLDLHMKWIYQTFITYRGYTNSYLRNNIDTKVYVNNNEISTLPVGFQLNNDEYIIYSFTKCLSFNKCLLERVDIILDSDARVAELMLMNSLN